MKYLAGSLLLLSLLLSGSSVSYAQQPDWRAYQALLDRHLSRQQINGATINSLDYGAINRDPLFNEVLDKLQGFPLDQLTNQQQRLAFYINAYNILAIRMIVDHWPLTSIRDAGAWYQSVWKKNIGHLGKKEISLDHIEHQVLRKMAEPRIHFAIVCASVSCPDLRDEPYRGDRLTQQLDDQTTKFLDNSHKGIRITPQGMQVSKLFKWFEEDFSDHQGVSGFIRQYRPRWPATIDGYLDYDWQVNATPAKTH